MQLLDMQVEKFDQPSLRAAFAENEGIRASVALPLVQIKGVFFGTIGWWETKGKCVSSFLHIASFSKCLSVRASKISACACCCRVTTTKRCAKRALACVIRSKRKEKSLQNDPFQVPVCEGESSSVRVVFGGRMSTTLNMIRPIIADALTNELDGGRRTCAIVLYIPP